MDVSMFEKLRMLMAEAKAKGQTPEQQAAKKDLTFAQGLQESPMFNVGMGLLDHRNNRNKTSLAEGVLGGLGTAAQQTKSREEEERMAEFRQRLQEMFQQQQQQQGPSTSPVGAGLPPPAPVYDPSKAMPNQMGPPKPANFASPPPQVGMPQGGQAQTMEDMVKDPLKRLQLMQMLGSKTPGIF